MALLIVALVTLLLLANVLGNSATATKLATKRNIKLQGAVSGNANFDGNENIVINTSLPNIQKETKTVKKDNGSTLTAIFKRSGNIVTVDFKCSIAANSMISLVGSNLEVPAFAKLTNEIDCGHIGASYDDNTVYKFHVHRYVDTGKTCIIGLITNQETTTRELSVSLTYVID